MNTRVLIIDDDEDIRTSVSIALEFLGFVCLEARDGEQGIALVREKRPDVVVLDYMMPKLDGADVCRMLREGNDRTPIILISADREILRKAQEIGAKAVIRKPFDIEELVTAIQRHAGHRQAGALEIAL